MSEFRRRLIMAYLSQPQDEQVIPIGDTTVYSVERFTSDTYVDSTSYTDDSFIMFNVTAGAGGGTVLYNGVSKTATASTTTKITYGKYAGVDDSTASSGDIVFSGDITAIAVGTYNSAKNTTAYCSCVTEIKQWAESLTSIPGYAFMQCANLIMDTIDTSYNMTSIGGCAFYGCSGIKNISIKNGVTTIGGEILYFTFGGCTTLEKLTISESVNSISSYILSNNSSLLEIKVQSSNMYYSSENGVLFNKDKTTLLRYPQAKTSTTYTIPSSVTSIGYYTFQGCTTLTNITIPSSVTSIGNYAFFNCTALTDITIPSSITSIGNSTFSGCYSLTSVTIPSSVTSIGANAIRSCTALTSITIPSSVATIGTGAFAYCNNLSSATFLHTSSNAVTLPTAGGNISLGSATGMLFGPSKSMTIYHNGNTTITGYAYATDNVTATLTQL